MDLMALLLQFGAFIGPYLVEFATKYPIIMTILGVVGFLRIIMKPAMSFARVVVSATSSKKDDLFLDGVEASKIYTILTYVLDWLGSIKIGPQAPEAQAAKLLHK